MSMLITCACSFVFAALPAARQSSQEFVIKVGPGGLTEREVDVYLRRAAKRIKRRRSDLSAEQREDAIEQAIEDEILYQAAVADKMLEDGHVKWRISSLYKSHNTTAKIDPRTFTDEELRAYYKEHPDEFTTPVELDLSVLRLPRSTVEELREALRKAKAIPDQVKGWKRVGWARQSQLAAIGIEKKSLAPLYRLQEGDVYGPVQDRFGIQYVFWVHGRKEAQLNSFEKSRARVVSQLVKEKQAGLARQLRIGVRGERPADKSDAELLYEAALKAGFARDWGVRQYVINAWVARQKDTRGDLLVHARRRFPVVR